MQKKGGWFVGDYLVSSTGLDLDVPGPKDGYGGGYRDGVVAVLGALRNAVPKHVLNNAFEQAVQHYHAPYAPKPEQCTDGTLGTLLASIGQEVGGVDLETTIGDIGKPKAQINALEATIVKQAEFKLKEMQAIANEPVSDERTSALLGAMWSLFAFVELAHFDSGISAAGVERLLELEGIGNGIIAWTPGKEGNGHRLVLGTAEEGMNCMAQFISTNS